MHTARPRILLTIAVAFLLPPAASSTLPENIRFRTLSVNDGLSQSAVNCIQQDEQGYIWLGTQDGLNRYDGYGFITHRHRHDDPRSLSGSYITCQFRDSRGTLWIGTYDGGLHRVHPGGNGILNVRRGAGTRAGTAGDAIMDITGDATGTLWIASWNGGVERFDPLRNTWAHLRHDPSDSTSLCDNRVRRLLVDHAGDVWICTFNGLDQYTPGTGRLRHHRHDPADPRTISSNVVLSAFEDAGGIVRFGTGDGRLQTMGPAREGFTQDPHWDAVAAGGTRGQILALLEDRGGVLWVGTRGGGLWRRDRARRTWHAFRHRSDDPTSLGGDFVVSLFQDRTGSLWVGTDGGGVSTYDPSRYKFGHLRHRPGDPRALSYPMVRALCEDREGNLWVGLANGRVDRFPGGAGGRRTFELKAGRAGVTDAPQVLCFLETRDGSMWAGTDGEGLFRYEPSVGQFCRVSPGNPDRSSFTGENVMALAEGRAGVLWIGTLGGGLRRLDRATGAWTVYRRSGSGGVQIPGDWIYALHEDTRGRLWVGTWGGGLGVLEYPAGSWKVFRHDPRDPESLSNNTIHAFHEGADGTMWIATMGGGLDWFSEAGGRFGHVTEDDGLANNVVYGILEDSLGGIWVSTNRGISRLSPDRRSIRTYGVNDGLQSLEFNQGAFCQGRDGRMAFGGINGVNTFYPRDIVGRSTVPPVHVTGVRVLDRPAPLPRDSTGILTVRHDQNLLTFEFCVLDFTAPELNVCRYMLEGVDRDWVDAENRRYVSYANLDAGEYRFRVQGRNSDGVWNTDGASLTVRVAPPFWSTSWFRVLSFVAALGVGFFAYSVRWSRLERERAAEAAFSRRLNESQERERKRIAGALHDSIGQDLLIIRHRLAAAAGACADPAILCAIGEAVQETIEDVRLIAADLHPHILDRFGLKRAVEAMLTSAAGAAGLSMASRIEDVDALFPPGGRINIYRIVQEAVANVIRHSHASECRVEIVRDASVCRIIIEDDGCGLSRGEDAAAARSRGGYGIASMMERARLLGGRLDLETSPGAGTRLQVTIPLVHAKGEPTT